MKCEDCKQEWCWKQKNKTEDKCKDCSLQEVCTYKDICLNDNEKCLFLDM